MSHPRSNHVSAIFVHAGAGFHSLHNERAHLETCESAVRIAMGILRNGGSAVDAVESAVMLLEDAEITNAGYGSNMTLNGTVECDATIIDHLGRSGAAGAVPQVKNPVSLARVIYEHSSKPLSLQRVPPNFLVGQGATDFAYEHGLVVLPHDALISPTAQERWNRWQKDLEAAEAKLRQQNLAQYPNDQLASFYRRPVNDHSAHLLATPSSDRPSSVASSPLAHHTHDTQTVSSNSSLSNHVNTSPLSSRSHKTGDGEYVDGATPHRSPSSSHRGQAPDTRASRSESPSGHNTRSGPATANNAPHGGYPRCDGHVPCEADIDRINDTVGAIAVDSNGNIAAASSSGGIGMKHRGRIGPAALVGIGTSVIPVDPSDPEKTCVATVTSGTGEHIATTIAAQTCAARVYYSQRKCKDGSYEEVTEDEAISAMIQNDFMRHPGVKDSPCQGAIGVMSVKKTADAMFLYFAHNTDSFALASMSCEDKKPTSVMSRSRGNGTVAQGGRVYRRRRHRVPDATAGSHS
ncbi:N-terminal nucleophile aminohydrolase [Aspergillus candidus]|uniref:N-terminal nucleophile aminohydrolase n=1 Tax=Aspergillus candidus TaxID=41067 RepID=A0A2I2FN92_ASPCN|nr:N-terminal nucleophile aminohydrolase [Aspergillus candidus]PLB42097.1 N-terminal nucleophile aminohydrolase [Aspergillus candidus]